MRHQLPVSIASGIDVRCKNKKHFYFLAGLYTGPDSPNNPLVTLNSLSTRSDLRHNSLRTAVSFSTSESIAETVSREFVARMSPHIDHELEASLVMSR